MRAFGTAMTYGAIPRAFDAVLWYCSIDDDNLCLRNQRVLRETGVPCWPSLELLEMWSDRRTKLFSCLSHGFVDDIEFSHWSLHTATRDTVVKVGNMHVGEGKMLVRAGEDFPYWPGLATLEPYVEGRSVRVYVVNDVVGGVEYVNDHNWIKNAPGAVTFEIELDEALVEHARGVHDLFGFPISGIDYIVRADGTFRFLEHNHFPGVTLHATVEKEIIKVMNQAMDDLEKAAKGG